MNERSEVSTIDNKRRSKFLRFLHEVKRSRSDRMLGGVCGGLAAHSQIPSWIYRALFLTLLLTVGFGLIPYVVLWICMPEEKSDS
jgi:phage shock protein PspC (stress-responsive transcriptional regulator)